MATVTRKPQGARVGSDPASPGRTAVCCCAPASRGHPLL